MRRCWCSPSHTQRRRRRGWRGGILQTIDLLPAQEAITKGFFPPDENDRAQQAKVGEDFCKTIEHFGRWWRSVLGPWVSSQTSMNDWFVQASERRSSAHTGLATAADAQGTLPLERRPPSRSQLQLRCGHEPNKAASSQSRLPLATVEMQRPHARDAPDT
jgi:hypothetical protein